MSGGRVMEIFSALCIGVSVEGRIKSDHTESCQGSTVRKARFADRMAAVALRAADQRTGKSIQRAFTRRLASSAVR
jgi:hypothetical protein